MSDLNRSAKMKAVVSLLVFAALALSVATAQPPLQAGAYDAHGSLNDLSAIQVEITPKGEFVATLVRFDHLPGPNGLERHVEEVRGSIISQKKGFITFRSNSKRLPWPLDQEFEIVSDQEIRTAQGYLTKDNSGWSLRPENTSYLVFKKKPNQALQPTAATGRG